MKNKILLFDIDRTIFDTSKLTEELTENLCKTVGNVDILTFLEAKNDYISSLKADREFDPENFTRFLCNKFNFNDQQTLLNVFYSLKNKIWYSDFIFPETFQVFDLLKDKFRLGIYSEGTKKFQNYKFESMRISKYLDKDLIFIFDHKTNLDAIRKIPRESIIIDDKESVCEYLNENKIKVIWLNKKDNRKSKKFETIHSLIDLSNVL